MYVIAFVLFASTEDAKTKNAEENLVSDFEVCDDEDEAKAKYAEILARPDCHSVSLCGVIESTDYEAAL